MSCIEKVCQMIGYENIRKMAASCLQDYATMSLELIASRVVDNPRTESETTTISLLSILGYFSKRC